MKKVLLLTCAALLVVSVPAFAQVELAWDQCKLAGGASDVAFPCGSADGSPKAVLMGSFVSPAAQPTLIAMDGEVDIQVSSAALPSFWDFASDVNPGACNPGAVFGDERPGGTTCAGVSTVCGTFPAGGQCNLAAGFLTTALDPSIGPNRSKLRFSIFRTTTTNAAAGTNYFVFHLDFYADLASESGGPCLGCADQAAFVWNNLVLKDPAGADVSVATPDCATWNGGTSICAATPTQSKTWGALKSLYR